MWRVKARDIADKPVLFVLLTDSFIEFICKTIETSILNVNSNNFPGPLIIGTFEKRVHGALIMKTYFASSFTEMNIFLFLNLLRPELRLVSESIHPV